MILTLALGAAGFLLAGCGPRPTNGAEVKPRPWMSAAEMAKGHQLVADTCGGCHVEGQGGSFSRISDMRKTPEGWDMTVARMINFHGLAISPADRRAVVRYLANSQGLAPAETQNFRYALERRPNVQELGHDGDLMHMCGRCHSYARFALQRRDRAEWVLLANMHLGQWPALEYQMHARERDWFVDATHEVPDKLASAYPFSTPAWEAWKAHGIPVMDGTWRVTGHRPGKGDYAGMARITKSRAGNLEVAYDLVYADGTRFTGATTANLFTGYEWRGQGMLDGARVQEVYELSGDGQKITGRWFLENADEIGGDLEARRIGAAPAILSVTPAYVKPGQKVEITVNGVGLDGAVDLGEGIKVSPVSADANRVVVKASVSADATPGRRRVKVGDVSGPDIAVYKMIDSLRVIPDYAVARVGGGGGPIAPVTAQFEAVGYLNGPDGEPGTDDDIRVGIMPVLWTTEPFDATAAAAKDEVFAGRIAQDGLFSPGPAGPNPKREFSGGNAGNLNVVATVKEGTNVVTGKAHLIVSPQRWNMPPIR